jgi:RNA polymerase sigma-70 factor (ECF subfamily)
MPVNGGAPNFDTVYTELYSRIVRYLARLVGSDQAEDISQEVFSKISRSLGEFRGESALSTWVYRIATTTAMDRLRSAEHRAALRSTSIEGGEACGADPGASAERQAIRAEMSDCIQGYLKELPENYRTVLVLSDMEGLKNAEVAEVLGVTPGTVKIRLHRARSRFKESLESHCSFYRDGDNTLLCDRDPGAGPVGKPKLVDVRSKELGIGAMAKRVQVAVEAEE